jgi:hypothetical protein
MDMLRQTLLVLAVLAALILPVPLLGRHLERRHKAGGVSAVRAASTAPRSRLTSAVDFLAGRDYVARKAANLEAGRNRATAIRLQRAEDELRAGLRAVEHAAQRALLRDFTVAEVREFLAERRRRVEWQRLSTGDFPVVASA